MTLNTCGMCGSTYSYTSCHYCASTPDAVNHPAHYTEHPSGVECIVVTEHLNFCIGNAIKYLWRAGQKGDVLEDLKKAIWYIQRELQRLEKLAK